MTQRRLGEWLRLWIILCLVYGGVDATLTFRGMPSGAPILTSAEFWQGLSPESLKVADRAGPYWDRIPLEKRVSENPVVMIRAPDGFEYALPADVTKDEEDRIRSEYQNMMETRLDAIRWSRIRSAVVWWLIPCIFVFCAGLVVHWVYSESPINRSIS